MSGGITVVSYPSRFIKLAVFFEPNAEGSLRLPDVGVVCVVVTRDVVDGAAQFLWGFCPWGERALSGWYCWAC